MHVYARKWYVPSISITLNPIKSLFCIIVLVSTILITGVSFLWGQSGSIYGTVVAANTREPLPYANIYLEGTRHGTVSDVNGFFSILGLPPGSQRLVASYIGYETFEEPVQLGSGQRLYREIALTPVAIQADSVIVTGDRNRRIGDIPIGLITLNFHEMKHTPSIGEPDVFRTLETFPGITTANDFNAGLYVRGGSRDQNQVLLDGIPIFNPYHALSIFSTFDAEAAKQIDLHKSGMDPAYGNFLSSVLDIHVKDGRSDHRSAKVNVSLLSSKVLLEGPMPRGSYMVSLRRTYLDAAVDLLRLVHIIPQNFRFPYTFTDGITSLTFKPTPANRIKVTGYWGRDEYRMSVIDNDPGSGDMVWGNRAVGLAWDRLLSQNLSLHLNLALSRYVSDFVPPDTTNPDRFEQLVSSRILRPYLHYKTPTLGTLRLGGEIKPTNYFFSIRGLSYQPIYLDSTSADERSLFATLFRGLGPRLTLKLGGRATRFTRQDTLVYSPQASLQLQATNTINLNLHWGRYHQGTMTLNNEDMLVSLFDAWWPVLENLPVMSADHYVLGGHYYPQPGYEFTLEAYFKRLHNLVEYNLQKFTAEDPDFVSGRGQAYGLELLAKKGAGRVQGWVAFTYSHARKTVQGITYPPKYDKPVDLSVVLSWPLGRKWRMGSRFMYQTGTPFTRISGFYLQHYIYNMYRNPFYHNEMPGYGSKNGARLPPYHRLDLNFIRPLTLRGRPFEFYLDLINVYARLNVLLYDRYNAPFMQMPPFLTFGLRGQL